MKNNIVMIVVNNDQAKSKLHSVNTYLLLSLSVSVGVGVICAHRRKQQRAGITEGENQFVVSNVRVGM